MLHGISVRLSRKYVLGYEHLPTQWNASVLRPGLSYHQLHIIVSVGLCYVH